MVLLIRPTLENTRLIETGHSSSPTRGSRAIRRAVAITLPFHVVVTCCILVVACASAPGVVGVDDLRVGPARYLDDTTTLLRVAGQPLHRRGPSVVSGGFEDVWDFQGFRCLLNGGWRCDQLITTDSSVLASRGVRAGMSVENMISTMGAPAHQRTSGDTLILSYDLKGKGRGFGVLVKATADTVRSIAVGQLTFVFM